MVVVSVLASILWIRGHRRLPLLMFGFAASLLVLAVVAPATCVRVHAGIGRGAVRLGNAVLRGCLVLVGALVVLPVWLLNRLIGTASLDDGWNGGSTAWRTRAGGRRPDGLPNEAWRMAAVEAPSGPGAQRGRRRRRGLGFLLLLVLGVGVLDRLGAAPWSPPDVPMVAARPAASGPAPVLDPLGESGATTVPEASQPTVGSSTTTPAPTTTAAVLDGAEDLTIVGLPVTTYAHEDEPWFPQHVRESEAMNASASWDPAIGVRYGEYEGETLSIVDGHRRSYQPEDPELVVWYFGGSTMFGLGQRDEHTIPSVVARLAERDGISIKSVNFGAMSTVNWSETIAFAEAISTEERPDLVVFYDGVNEVGNGFSRVEMGQLDPDRSIRSLVTEEERRLTQRPVPEMTVEEQNERVIELAAAQYRRGVDLGRAVADANDVEILHFWQPSFDSKLIGPADAEGLRRVGIVREEGERGERSEEIVAAVDADVIDLSRALDDADRPVFWDWGHTNEYGAAMVAEAMYEQLKGPIQELLAQQ